MSWTNKDSKVQSTEKNMTDYDERSILDRLMQFLWLPSDDPLTAKNTIEKLGEQLSLMDVESHLDSLISSPIQSWGDPKNITLKDIPTTGIYGKGMSPETRSQALKSTRNRLNEWNLSEIEYRNDLINSLKGFLKNPNNWKEDMLK